MTCSAEEVTRPLGFVPGIPESYRSRQGTLCLWRPARGVLLTRVVGVLRTDAAAAIETAVLKTASEERRIISFHDWEEMTNYDSESRVRLTAVAESVQKVCTGIHFLVRSPIVALGVRTANLMLGGRCTLHPSRAGFERALRRALEP